MARPKSVIAVAADEIRSLAFSGEVLQFESAYTQLSTSERLFVDAFLIKDSPRSAALAAFPDYASRPTLADVRALDYMRQPLVKAAIAEKLREAAAKTDITVERVINEIALVAFARMGDFIRITPDGEPFVDLSEATPEQLAAIAEVQVEDFKDGRGDDARDVRRVKFKLHDKLSGLDKLMRRFGAYAPERTEISGPGGGAIPVAQITAEMTAEQAAELYARSLESDEE